MANAEIYDEAGATPALIAHFPRTRIAIGAAVVSVVLLCLPLVWLPFSAYGGWDVLGIVVALALLFGWYLVLLFVTAWRGGYLALTKTGVLIQTGYSSLLIPWADITAVGADVDTHAHASNPVLRLSIRRDAEMAGWPWPAAMSPVLIGSWGRNLRMLAWWFQPVSLDWMVRTVRFLASHPEERHNIGIADPDRWLDASSAERRVRSKQKPPKT